jgi:hypothetical protein
LQLPTRTVKLTSAVFDQRTNTLFVNIHQTFSIWFIPLYAARVRLITVLHLKPRTSWAANETVSRGSLTEGREPAALSGPGQERAKYYISSQEDLYQMNDCVQFLMPRLGRWIWLFWQLFSTGVCVLCAVLFLPVYYMMNGSKTAKKVA